MYVLLFAAKLQWKGKNAPNAQGFWNDNVLAE